jgi:tRNA(fMet)-specific endonuclease VapC
VTYLLDTNACIAVINGNPQIVRIRLDRALNSGADVYVSSVVLFELWYGVAKSARREANAKRVELFFSGPIVPLPFDGADAESAGLIRAGLESAGTPIGAYDVLIAGQALRRNFTLVTANAREFRRIKSLACQDWARP